MTNQFLMIINEFLLREGQPGTNLKTNAVYTLATIVTHRYFYGNH